MGTKSENLREVTFLTIGAVAVELGIREWQMNALINRGLIPTPLRLGSRRMWVPSDLPGIKDAAVKAGYLSDVASLVGA